MAPSHNMFAMTILLLSSLLFAQELAQFYIEQQMMLIEDETVAIHNNQLASMTTLMILKANPGFRKYWGTPNFYNDGFYETVLQMISLNPWQFRGKFRMWPSTFFDFEADLWNTMFPSYVSLAELRSPDPSVRESAGRKRIRGWKGPHPNPELFRWRLLVTIYFLASGCTYATLSDVWGCSIVWGDLLVKEIAAMKPQVVRWPIDPTHQKRIVDTFSLIPLKFRMRLGIVDRLLGCIDGTFVRILKPLETLKDKQGRKKDPELANSYKKYYAIQNLAVCGPNFLFYFFATGFVGSLSDSTMLPRSHLFKYVWAYIPLGYYLFGDAGFGLLPWLMTPYTKVQLDKIRREKGAAGWTAAWVFNEIQASLRVHIEQSFGILKNRWRILKEIRVRYPHAPATIDACVVLHNYVILHNDIWHIPPADDSDPQNPLDPDAQSKVEEKFGIGHLPEWADDCPAIPAHGYVPASSDSGPYYDKKAAIAKRNALAQEWKLARFRRPRE
jgi:hypothetical protein